MGQDMQVNEHRHEASFRYAMSSHKGVNLGTCACGTPVQEFEVQGRRIAIERATDKTIDLFERARSLGWDDQAAAKLADCWENWDLVADPCMIHPNHSVTQDDQGFATDGCVACLVLIRTFDENWDMAGWLAKQAQRATELAAMQAQDAIECAIERDIIEGRKPRTVTACGTFALGETVKHAEMGEGTIVYLGSVGGMEVEFANGMTTGVGDDYYGEWAQVRTDAPDTIPTDEAMAEAEADDQASGIDVLRELLVLPAVGKVAVVHLLVGVGRTAAGRLVSPRMTVTTDTGKVTCKCCPKTRQFAKLAQAEAVRVAQDIWAGAGLVLGTVVRNKITGHLGMINELTTSIRVGYWTGPQVGSSYARLVDFDNACELITARDLGVESGVRMVSNLGGECTVEEVGSAGIWASVDGESGARMWTLSELAAEIARGWLVVVPKLPTMIMHSVSGRHEVTSFDLAQVGYRVTVAAGSPRNGRIVHVSPQGALVEADNAPHWVLTLAEMVNGNVGVWLPDAQGRPVGSWR